MRRACFNVMSAVALMWGSAAFAIDNAGSAPRDPGLWHASEFAGVPIRDPSRITVGKVTDLLLNRKGKAKYVVIGLGGVFGIGEKHVTIPFKEVRFTDREIAAPPNPVNISSTGAPAGSPGASAAGGLANRTSILDMRAADQVNRRSGRPEYGMVDMTADQLRDLRGAHHQS